MLRPTNVIRRLPSQAVSISTGSKKFDDQKCHACFRYSSRLLQQAQELLFSDNFFKGTVRLFLLTNKIYVGVEDGKFSVFDEDSKLWTVYNQNRLYSIFSASVNNIVKMYIRTLERYIRLLSTTGWDREDLPADADLLAVTNMDSEVTEEIWHDLQVWEAVLLNNLRFVIEDLDNPETYICSCSCNNFHSLISSHNYLSSDNVNDSVNDNINDDVIFKPKISFFISEMPDLEATISRLIGDLKHLSRRIVNGFSSDRNQIVTQILESVCYNEPSVSENNNNTYSLIGLAKHEVLDLATWQLHPRTRDHNISAACEREYDGCSTTEVDKFMTSLFSNPADSQHLLSLLGLALLCPPAPSNCLYIVSCSQDTKVTLKRLLSTALGDLYYEAEIKLLKEEAADSEDFNKLRDRRIVVFDVPRLSHELSTTALEAYFKEDRRRLIGGKQYFFNTSFILLCRDFSQIDSPLLREYDSKNLIYYVNVDRDVPESASREVCSNSFSQAFFVSLVQSTNDCYNYLQNSDISTMLPLLPPPASAPDTKSIKKHVYKSILEKLDNRQVFSSFMEKRVLMDSKQRQLADEFRDNFRVYLQEQGLDDLIFSDISIGKHLISVFSDNNRRFESKREREHGKDRLIYFGLCSYDHDIS